MKQRWFMGVAASAILAAATPAAAQDAGTAGAAAGQNAPPPAAGNAASQPDSTASTAAATPGDIIVTAQKRSERLQDVPVAVSVISGDAISAKGGTNLESAQYLVPTLNFPQIGNGDQPVAVPARGRHLHLLDRWRTIDLDRRRRRGLQPRGRGVQ